METARFRRGHLPRSADLRDKEGEMPEPTERRVTAAVLRDAIAGGSIRDSLELFGDKLPAEQRAALAQISDVELAALRSIAAKRLDLPGDKLA